MNHLFQPNPFACVPTAFAMCLGLTPAEMFHRLGHDGTSILWPGLHDPFCRRGFSLEECIPVCLDEFVFPVIMSKQYTYKPEGALGDPHVLDHSGLIARTMSKVDGVIAGFINGKFHSVAWDFKEQRCYDPEGGCGPLTDYDLHFFVALF